MLTGTKTIVVPNVGRHVASTAIFDFELNDAWRLEDLEQSFRWVTKGVFKEGEYAGQASVSKWFKKVMVFESVF